VLNIKTLLKRVISEPMKEETQPAITPMGLLCFGMTCACIEMLFLGYVTTPALVSFPVCFGLLLLFYFIGISRQLRTAVSVVMSTVLLIVAKIV
jgi:hypothetical protein